MRDSLLRAGLASHFDDAYELAMQQGSTGSGERLVEDLIAHGELEGYLRRIEYYGFPRQPPDDFQPPGSPELVPPEQRTSP